MSPEAKQIPPIRIVSSEAPFKWLEAGWRDFRKAGFPSLLHGVIVTVISIAILGITLSHWHLLPGAVSGFVLAGPVLATGLYALSRRIENGRSTSVKDAYNAWRHSSKCLFVFCLLLLFAATAWVVFSVIMFKFFIDVAINTPHDFVRYALTQNDLTFMLWTILGALGAALAFAITVVSMPLLIERDVNTKLAVLTSIRAVGNNPIVMLLWAMTIMIITGFSFITGMLGFILLYPLIGHASWHVYRDVVDADSLPLREHID